MRGSRIQVIIEFFDVFAVVSFVVGQTEEPLFENRIMAVPQCQSQTEPLVVIANARNAVLPPSISSAARVVMRKVLPRISLWTVVLSHCPPLALGEVRPPSTP